MHTPTPHPPTPSLPDALGAVAKACALAEDYARQQLAQQLLAAAADLTAAVTAKRAQQPPTTAGPTPMLLVDVLTGDQPTPPTPSRDTVIDALAAALDAAALHPAEHPVGRRQAAQDLLAALHLRGHTVIGIVQ